MNDLSQYRPILFVLIASMVFILEKIRPSYNFHRSTKRLTLNALMFIGSIIIFKICFPFGLAGLADKFASENKSLFILSEFIPGIGGVVITILIFDFAIYWQHRLFHLIPFLWKSHAIHHGDKQMDLTTALRFHPLEILLSGIYKIFLIYLLGPTAEVFLLYEVLLNGFALFNHGNFRISPKLDKWLRWIIVTPAMHYPHHSPKKELTNMNFGNILSIWDRIFGTYTHKMDTVFGLDFPKKEVDQDSPKFWFGYPFKR